MCNCKHIENFKCAIRTFLAELPRALKAPAGGAPLLQKLVTHPAEKIWMSRPYARIRAWEEFVFVLDLESFSGKQ